MKDSDYKTFLFSYHFEGHEWTLELPALNAAEAQDRMKVLSHRAHYDGQLMAKIPARYGLFVRAWCAIRNFFRSNP